jgi:phospholipase/carboxylesterase
MPAPAPAMRRTSRRDGSRSVTAADYNLRVTVKRIEIAGLTTYVVGRDDAKLTAILLHGFGAPGDDLVGVAEMIDAPVRFVFPEAPLELSGMYGDARAWWLLDLAKLEEQLRSGDGRARMTEVPDGLANARTQVSRLVDQVVARFATTDDKIVLGGFSQGAMVATDVALHRDAKLSGLVVLSGTLIAEPEWAPRFAHLAGLHVFMSHGRADPILPFAMAEMLRDRLTTAGAVVAWHQFVGGHQIPPMVTDELGAFLRARAA